MDIENEGNQQEIPQEESKMQLEKPTKENPKRSTNTYEKIPLPIPNYTPAGIECIAYNHQHKYLAVARSNATFEIWNYDDWTLLSTFLCHKQCQIRRLLFLNDTPDPVLVVGFSNCMLQVYNLKVSPHPIYSKTTSGNALWDMKINKNNELALAYDDGTVKIYTYDPEEPGFVFEKVFRPQPEKALSVAWDPQGGHVYAGFQNGKVRKYDRKSGAVLFTINLKNYEVVWALQAPLSGNVIAMGTSEGYVHFYETRHGTMVSEIKTHEADVLCLEINTNAENISAEEETVYASGADSKIVALQCVTEEGEMGNVFTSKWIQTSSDRGQSHDVKALCLAPQRNQLLSGGLTTDICIYELEEGNLRNRKQINQNTKSQKKVTDEVKLRHITALPMKKVISVSNAKNLVLFQMDYSIELWEFEYDGNEFNFLIQLKTKDFPITSSAINRAGKLLAYSTIDETHIFSLNVEEKTILQKISSIKPSSCLALYANLPVLFRVDYETNAFHRVEVNPAKPVKTTFTSTSAQPGLYEDMDVSPNKEVVVFGSKLSNQIYYYHNEFRKTGNLGKVVPFFKDSSYTCFRVTPQNDLLLIVYSNNKFCFFNLNQGTFTKWSREHVDSFPLNYMRRYNKIIGAVFDSNNNNNLVLYSHYYMIRVYLNEKMPRLCNIVKTNKETGKKMNKRKGEEEPTNFEMTYFENPTLLLDFLNADQLVSVSADWKEISARFPYAVNAKKYGL